MADDTSTEAPYGRRAAHLTLIVGLLLATPAASFEVNPAYTAWFDDCVRSLCVDTVQMNCWIKNHTPLCDKGGIMCRSLSAASGAKVLRKEAAQWEVLTREGRGWVSGEFMRVSGDKCPPSPDPQG